MCTSDISIHPVILTGTGNYLGGTFSSTNGIVINPTTGEISPYVSAPGTYTITYTIPPGSGCPSVTASITVSINDQPFAGTDSQYSICGDSTTPIDLYSMIAGEDTGGTWTRTSGTGGTFNSAGGIFTPAVGTTTSTFEYTIIGPSPCGNDTCIVTINFNAFPTNITITGSTTICAGSSANLTITGIPGTNITWEASGIPSTFVIGASGNTTILVSPTATTTYSLLSASLDGCNIPLTQSATVAVNAVPNAGTDGSTTVCESFYTIIDLHTLITGEQAGGTWGRTSGTGGTFNAAAGTFAPPAIGATTSTFTYTINGSSPCSDNTSVATVNINPQPIAGLDGTTSVSEASTTPVDLFALITDEQLGGVWTRIMGTGGTFNAAAATFTPAVGATTSSFTYTLTGTAPCVNDTSIATINIDVVPVGMSNTSNQTITNGDFSNIVLSSSNVPGSNFIWTYTANNISGASNDSGTTISQQLSLIDPNLDGYVDYTITPVNNSANGNSFTARVGIQSLLGSETFTTNTIKLSPNPVTDILNIENEYQINSIKVYNQLGQMVFGKEINNNSTQLDLSVINSGIYNVLIETEKGTINHKIVKK